jgi:phage/plasmid-like protein (TIGR03299 family)
MMYAGQVPWHGIGTAVEREVTAVDALKLAGLDWQVRRALVFTGAGIVQRAVERAWATVRMSDGKPLGIVGERYVPVQNDQAFAFFDDIVGAGQAIYHAAGALDGGRKVWILAKLPGDILIREARDVVERYLLLVNSHDGSTALRMLMTPIRVVCQNTLSIALRQGAADGIAIRHTASATARLDEARRALGLAHHYYDEFASEVDRLACASYSDAQMKALVESLLPGVPDEVSTRTRNQRARIISLFTEGQGHAAIAGTAWAALNAVAEYVDHVRSVRGADVASRAEKRLASAWLGSGAAFKRAAHQTILEQLAA